MTKRQKLDLIFSRDTVALLGSVFFLWCTIGLVSDSKYTIKDLIRHTGYLVQTDTVIVKSGNRFREPKIELELTLHTESSYFTSVTEEDIEQISSEISIGDTVTIFTKPKRWGIFGMKRAGDISQLTKGTQIIVDFEASKQSMWELSFFTLLGAVFFLWLYFKRVKERISSYKKADLSHA